MRKLSALGCVLAAGLMFCIGRSWDLSAKPKDDKPVLRTRVALVNMPYILQNCDRFKNFQDEMKTAANSYQEKEKQLAKRVEELGKEFRNEATPPERRAELEKKLKKVQRQMEDNRMAAKETLSKRADTQVQTMFKDIQDAARRYARAHDFDMVLHYSDAVKEQDYYSTANISRKLQSGGLMPLYAAPGMDISKDIVAVLNEQFKATQEEAEPKEEKP
jgi:Skp family chaperone for outer membrane proteins